jgi:DNA-binding transcriptional MocR family regulator
MYAVRGLFPLEKTPGVISLLAGKPNDAMFPFANVQFSVPHPDSSEQMLLKVDDDILSMGLQYAPTSGIPPMVEWLTNFQEQEHGRRRQEGWRISVAAGSQDAIYKVRPLYQVISRWSIDILGCTCPRGSSKSSLDREACVCVSRDAHSWSFIV